MLIRSIYVFDRRIDFPNSHHFRMTKLNLAVKDYDDVGRTKMTAMKKTMTTRKKRKKTTMRKM